MKLQIVSDLHLEWGVDVVIENKGADVLILGGDICTARNATKFIPFFKRCSEAFKHVVYLPGNHEFYHSDIATASSELKIILGEGAPMNNVHFIHNRGSFIELSGVPIFGATLWTDCNNGDGATFHALRSEMNDYRLIWDSAKDEIFTPEDSISEHMISLDYLESWLVNEVKGRACVVCTHHSPTLKSISPRYKDDHLMNGGYHSDLSWVMKKYPNIVLWSHGHCHTSLDIIEYSTRVVCNPAGYPVGGRGGRENPEFDPGKIFEI